MGKPKCIISHKCLKHHCFCEKTIAKTTEEELGIIKQPGPLCYRIDTIINIMKENTETFDEETITLLNELLEKLREEVMDLREWGQAFKYKTINLIEKSNYDKSKGITREN